MKWITGQKLLQVLIEAAAEPFKANGANARLGSRSTHVPASFRSQSEFLEVLILHHTLWPYPRFASFVDSTS